VVGTAFYILEGQLRVRRRDEVEGCEKRLNTSAGTYTSIMMQIEALLLIRLSFSFKRAPPGCNVAPLSMPVTFTVASHPTNTVANELGYLKDFTPRDILDIACTPQSKTAKEILQSSFTTERGAKDPKRYISLSSG
jgi:hypothetical protein